MEPIIYKPSVYNGPTVYNTGSYGGGYTPEFGTVELWGKTYNTVTINGLTWTCQNLDYKWDSLPIGHNTTIAQACYPEDNENIWGWNGRKCGLLYNKAAKEELANNLNTWRIPSRSDLDKLFVSLNAYFDVSYKLTKNSYWSSRTGDDEIGFSELPCGAYESGWQGITDSWYIHSQSNIMAISRPDYYYMVVTGTYLGNWYMPIRLCKDA